MQHNYHIASFEFAIDPIKFNKWTDKEILKYCLGATLYLPSTRTIAQKIINRSINSLTSLVFCFEDAIPETDLGIGEDSVLSQLELLSRSIDENKLSFDQLPLIFLRVRNMEQFENFSKRLLPEHVRILCGFVFPKLFSENSHQYFTILSRLNEKFSSNLYAMPILEGKEVANQETRIAELVRLKGIFDKNKSQILNVRIGGTDFSSLFGLRRSITTTIYDILPVQDIVSDILNFFSRVEDGYVISGPVWEYFLADKDYDLNELIGDTLERSILKQEPIVNDAIDGLIREVMLDKTNGMVGETVIHPSHLMYVNAMQAITFEEYNDSLQIIESKGGVFKSEQGNKMNEIAPHTSWAHNIVSRGKAYGVIKEKKDLLKLLKN